MEDRRSRSSLRDSRPARVNLIRQVGVVFFVGALLATLFTAWTPLGLVPFGLGERIGGIFTTGDEIPQQFPTATPRPRPRIGIVAGHYKNDTGAICTDGLQEVDVNLDIAARVKENLVAENFDVDLLSEKDERLYQYNALALVSIHSDSCNFINNEATGFKVAAALATIWADKANRMIACMTNRYQARTGLSYHAGSITADMTSYHAFEEIHTDTIAVIIETGFLNLDRQILTQQPDLIAAGISDGILCYIYNEDASIPPAP